MDELTLTEIAEKVAVCNIRQLFVKMSLSVEDVLEAKKQYNDHVDVALFLLNVSSNTVTTLVSVQNET